MKKLLLALILLATYSISSGQAGTLDQSFGNNGIVRTDFGTDSSKIGGAAREIFVHPDGSIYLFFNTNGQAFIVHYFSNGALDAGYGENGFSVPVRMGQSRAVMQPDGKIVVAGTVFINENHDFAVARFNTNGTLDNSFSGDGVQTTDLILNTDAAYDVALQADGKIVVVGTAGGDFALVRYNPDGSLDNSFSNDGKQLTDMGGSNDAARGIAIQSDGKLVVAGSSYTFTGGMAVARYLQDGTPDNSFSVDGKEIFYVGGFSSASALTIQSDGKILLAGYTVDLVINPGNMDFAIARLNADGTLDNSFSDDGKQTIEFGSTYEQSEAILVQNDGKIIVGGWANVSPAPTFALARYHPNGTPDNSFSNDGKLTTQVGSSANLLFALALQPDAKILAAGVTSDDGYALVRYNADGSLDNSFDNDGILIDGRPGGTTNYYASVVQPDGKIVTAGFTLIENNYYFVVARYNINGSLDNSFSDDGMLIIEFGHGQNFCYALALQPDGKIILAGSALNGSDQDFALARVNPDGSLDNSFSGDGKLLTDLRGQDDAVYDIAIQSDGKIVVAGSSFLSDQRDFALARYNTDGSPDNSFSGDGIVITDFGSTQDFANAVLIQPDGKIVAIGAYDWFGNNSDVALARYNINGELDPTFDGDGKVITDYFGGRDWAADADLQPDGKIVVAGNLNSNNGSEFVLARYNTNGSLDNSFSDDGIMVFDGGSTSEYATSITIQPDGKFLVGGFAHGGSNNDLALLRFNQNGTPDNSFSGDGLVIMDLGYGEEAIESLSIWNNRVYAAGSTMYGSTVGLLAAFLLGDVIVPCSMTLAIPDAATLNSGVNMNTVYIGYAPATDLSLMVQPSGGTAPYSYLWSNGATTPSITVFPTIATTYTVTVTDATGCSKTASKLVNVVDIRCGNKLDKVLVCKVPPGNPSNANSNCISANAVAAHLNNGGYLGNCNTGLLTTKSITPEQLEINTVRLDIYPNPANKQFSLILRSVDHAMVNLVIWDNLGRIVERRQTRPNQLIQLGASYHPGTYFAELTQGNIKFRRKLVKQGY